MPVSSGERIARKLAVDLAVGSGSGEPKGILTGTADVSMAASNSFVSVTNGALAKLMALVNSVDPAYQANGKFVMNLATWSDICAVVDTTGRPLLAGVDQSAFGAQQKNLFGYPVVIDQSFPSAADGTNFMVFGDLSEAYVLRNVAGVHIMVDPYTRAANGQVCYNAWARYDGTVQNRFAYAILGGK